jgi:Protein of unknown function (DUF3300)
MISSGSMSIKKVTAILCLLSVLGLGSMLPAQESPYDGPAGSFQPSQPQFSPGELTNLVAPVALYPDPLLSQVLVVSTYPQELMAAAQWLQQYGYLQGRQLMAAAQQQNWDPSVQALVAFPSVVGLLTSNMQWTAELGQAFLAQPSDVMNAIQYLRARARAGGQLAPSSEFSVNAEFQNGQSAIEIQPADPQTMYVPAYDPSSVWGPPAAGAYPDLSYAGTTFGSLISAAVNLAGLFTGFPGLLGPGGWGWALGWLAHTLFVNNSFFSHFGFANGGGAYAGSSPWVHNNRRAGPYGTGGSVWSAFGGNRNFSRSRPASAFAPARPSYGANSGGRYPAATSGDWQRFSHGTAAPVYQASNRFAQPSAPLQRSWNGNRAFPPDNRFVHGQYPTRPANYRAPVTSREPRQPSYSNFPSFNNAGTRSAAGAFRQPGRSLAHPFRSSQPREDYGRSFRPEHSSVLSRAPKPPRMPKAPHMKAPHFKSHGSGHFSHGHSGGKSHRW